VRIVATDYDRTLVWTDAELHERTIAAMRSAHDAGIPVIVVTGRMVKSVRRALEPAGIAAPVIAYQGAVVADEDGTWLRHEPVPVELAREIVAALAGEGVSPNVYVDDELYVAAETEEARAYASLNHIDFHVVGPLLDWLDDAPTKIVAVGEPGFLDAIAPKMKERFGARAFVSKSLPQFLEFAQAGVTKGAGMDFLAERLGFTRDEVVAFGDGENDIELVEWPAYGVATENAHPSVKAVARWVCPSAEEEGVAQVLEALLALDSPA
jgi:Cof subfamily protein (haloacid dehalogenase superfamily)